MNTKIVVAAIVAFVLVLAITAAGLTVVFWPKIRDAVPAAGLSGNPSATREGEEWNHTELLAFLKTKGAPFEGRRTNEGEERGPAQHWVRIADAGEEEDPNLYFGNVNNIYVQKCETAAKAKDQAGTVPGAYHWGRFWFRGKEAAALDKIRKALK